MVSLEYIDKSKIWPANTPPLRDAPNAEEWPGALSFRPSRADSGFLSRLYIFLGQDNYNST